MLFTEENVRHNIRNKDGKRVFYLGKGDQLTSSARDWLAKERIPILPADQAKPEGYKLLSGGILTEKPEHMTHLNAEVLVPKTHPRIRFRGRLDALEGELLTVGAEYPHLRESLGEILSLVREIIRCDVLDEPLKKDTLCGLTEAEQRKRSHFPQDYYGIPHFMPDFGDSKGVLALNRLRAAAREAELAGLEAFSDREGLPTRADFARALNRLSSMLYILMLQEKAK